MRRLQVYWRYDCVVELLKHSANVNALSKFRCTPIELACRHAPQPERIVKALIDAGSERKIVNDQKRSLLHYATLRGLTKTVNVLLEVGEDPFAGDKNKFTALDMAIHSLFYNVVVSIVRDNSMYGRLVLSTKISFETKLQQRSLGIAKTLLIGGCVAGPVVNWIAKKEQPVKMKTEFASELDLILNFRETPQLLKNLCRVVIRHAIKRRIVTSVNHLPLPGTLRRYVSMNEFLTGDFNADYV